MSRINWFECWRAADRAANEAMRATERKSMLARDGVGHSPSEAEMQAMRQLREVADALFQQATVAMRIGTRRAVNPPRLGYDDMWSLVLEADRRTRVGCPALPQQRAA